MLVRSALRDLWHEGVVEWCNTAQGFTSCSTAPLDHTPHQHQMVFYCSVANREMCADFQWCLLTVFVDIAQSIWHIQHVLDYAIYGQGSALDVAHKVTIKLVKQIIWSSQSDILCTVYRLTNHIDIFWVYHRRILLKHQLASLMNPFLLCHHLSNPHP